MSVLNLMILGFALLFSACNKDRREDAKDLAEELNEQKFDTTRIEGDTEFMVEATDAGSLEIELGELAQTNGSDQSVKDFGKKMVTDHAMANDEVAKIAKQKNISLPIDLSDKKQEVKENFAALKGSDFDQAYAAYIVDEHKEDIEEFEKAAKNAKDPQIKAWAAAKVPTLRGHLEMAEALRDKIKYGD